LGTGQVHVAMPKGLVVDIFTLMGKDGNDSINKVPANRCDVSGDYIWKFSKFSALPLHIAPLRKIPFIGPMNITQNMK